MPNPIKYTTGSETNALKKGNFYIGTGDVGKGPSDTTGFYQGVSPSSGGYVIYMNNTGAPGSLSYHNAPTDAELISFTNSLAGQSYTTVNECLTYYAGQTDKVCVNRDYEGIVTDGLVLNLDAGFTPSYPRSGTTWSDISLSGNTGTLTNGPTFDSGDGGSIVFDGVDDVVTLGNVSSLGFTNGIFSVSAWLQIPSTWTTGSQYPNLVSKGASAGWDTDGWSLYIFRNRGGGTGYSIGLGMRNGATAFSGREVNNLPTNTIFNVVATAEGSGNSIKLYINGILSFTGTQTINPASNTNSVTIARGPLLHWFPGNVYSVQIYNRTLTASEILQNFNAQKGRFGL